MKIKVDFSFFITLILFFSVGDFIFTAIMLFSALIHETGHIIVIRILGIKIKMLELGLFGGTLFLDNKFTSYKSDLFVALSGSLFNLVFSLILFFLLRVHFSYYLFFFFLSNLLYALFNLLPVLNLDGGEALRAVLLMKKEPFEVERLMAIITRITLFLLACTGLYLVTLSSFNVSLFVLLLLLYAESSNSHIISGYEFCRSAS